MPAIVGIDIPLASRAGAEIIWIRLRDEKDRPYDMGGKTLRLDVGTTREDAEGGEPLLRLEEATGGITQGVETDPDDGLPTLEIAIYLTVAAKEVLGGEGQLPYDLLQIDPYDPDADPDSFIDGWLFPKFEVKA